MIRVSGYCRRRPGGGKEVSHNLAWIMQSGTKVHQKEMAGEGSFGN